MPDPRSYLYVPGDRPEFLEKATLRNADALIVDLEDAVPMASKDDARRTVMQWLEQLDVTSTQQVWIRVNPGAIGEVDMEALAGSFAITGFCLAKTEAAGEVEDRAALLARRQSRAQLMPLLESAGAIFQAVSIAQAPRVARLQIGEADLAADTGIDPSPGGGEFAWARSVVVFASAKAGVGAPVAPVDPDFRDLAALRESTENLRRSGFFGRACIHPAQLDIVNATFTTTGAAVEAARLLLASHASSGAGVSVGSDGRMVDEAVLRSARRLVEQAAAGR